PSITPSLRKDGVNHKCLVLLNNFRGGLLGPPSAAVIIAPQLVNQRGLAQMLSCPFRSAMNLMAIPESVDSAHP
ncbi:hypothetical protein, partial [Sphingobium sp.]|uniref:hypothetical protein n=1 Tax=Sphingobium sp. TaxID=1912891 RepID=UPI00257C957B